MAQPRRRRRAGPAAAILLIALAFPAPALASEAIEARFCEAPAAACGATLEDVCLRSFGVAPGREPAACADQLGAYRACLQRAVRDCGGLAQAARSDRAALDAEALYAAPSITISLKTPPRPPGLSPAEVSSRLRCRKNPGCAAQHFVRHHAGELIFDIDQRDRSSGELTGWLPQSAFGAAKRSRWWRNHSGRAVVSGNALVIEGAIFTERYRPQCSINLVAAGPRTLSGTVNCRNMRPIEATAQLDPA